MKFHKSMLAAALTLVFAGTLQAKLTDEEIKKLGGPEFTEFGAERAGTKDGLVPAYTGGLGPDTKVGGVTKGTCKWPDPYASEQPLFTITAANMDKYAAYLGEIPKALLKRYPNTFAIKVYPSHRSVHYPQWVLDETLKNVNRPYLSPSGYSLRGAKQQIPFPVPKSAMEIFFDSQTRYRGVYIANGQASFFTDASGRTSLVAQYLTQYSVEYWDRAIDYDTWLKDPVFYRQPTAILDGRSAGENDLFWQYTDYENFPAKSWSYQPGQRRVRAAPDFFYDYPMPTQGGIETYDQNEGGLYGAPDRYNWKLLGKKVMLVPYNGYKFEFQLPIDKIVDEKNHLHQSPDAMRFEYHRVWVVEETLRPDARHIYGKRIIYVDEDSYAPLLDEAYDMQGKLFRGGFWPVQQAWTEEVPWHNPGTFYDLSTGAWLTSSIKTHTGVKGVCFGPKSKSKTEMSPQQLQGLGIR